MPSSLDWAQGQALLNRRWRNGEHAHAST